MYKGFLRFVIIVCSTASTYCLYGQGKPPIQWTPDGNGYYQLGENGILKVDIRTGTATPIVDQSLLTSLGGRQIVPVSFRYSNDNTRMLLFTNTAKVWRYNTRGDYWLLNIPAKKLTQLGKGRPAQSRIFSKN